MNREELQAAVLALDPRLSVLEKSDRASVSAPAEALLSLLSALRDYAAFSFDMLSAHTAVDRPALGLIEVLYQLHSTTHGHSFLVQVPLTRAAPLVPSVSALWPIAEWQEREVYDLFGVLYSGHPDLRRIFLEDDWQGFPLRKDYKDSFLLERPW